MLRERANDIHTEVRIMSTEKQKEAARGNVEKAREVQSERAHGAMALS